MVKRMDKGTWLAKAYDELARVGKPLRRGELIERCGDPGVHPDTVYDWLNSDRRFEPVKHKWTLVGGGDRRLRLQKRMIINAERAFEHEADLRTILKSVRGEILDEPEFVAGEIQGWGGFGFCTGFKDAALHLLKHLAKELDHHQLVDLAMEYATKGEEILEKKVELMERLQPQVKSRLGRDWCLKDLVFGDPEGIKKAKDWKSAEYEDAGGTTIWWRRRLVFAGLGEVQMRTCRRLYRHLMAKVEATSPAADIQDSLDEFQRLATDLRDYLPAPESPTFDQWWDDCEEPMELPYRFEEVDEDDLPPTWTGNDPV